MSNSNNEHWDAWIQQRAAESPSGDFSERMKKAVLAEIDSPSVGNSTSGSIRVAGPWERRLQSLSERAWGRLTLCAAALLLGMTPYIGALAVLNR